MVLIVQRAGYTLGMTSKPGRRVLPFPDRRAAGRILAERLGDAVDLDQWTERTVVLGLPRGGVAVAPEGAAIMGRPVEVLLSPHIRYPRHPGAWVRAPPP